MATKNQASPDKPAAAKSSNVWATTSWLPSPPRGREGDVRGFPGWLNSAADCGQGGGLASYLTLSLVGLECGCRERYGLYTEADFRRGIC